MNKPLLRAVSSTPELMAEPDATEGLGASLRAMRKVRGHTLPEVSTRLKYSVRQLEALENEQWEKLPRGVLLRGLVKNYARFLETDVDALLIMLDNQAGAQSATPVPISAKGASLPQADMPLHPEGGSRSWGWLLVILTLLIVLVIYAINRGWVPDAWLIFDWLKALKQ